MQHRRPRLMAKILAFVLAVSLVFPVSAFASVADLADDTRAPGKSLANTYPNLPVDWQVSLAEDTKDVTVKVPVSLTADELTAAIDDYFHYRELSFVDRQLYNTEDIRVSQIRLQHEVKTDEETRTRHIQSDGYTGVGRRCICNCEECQRKGYLHADGRGL